MMDKKNSHILGFTLIETIIYVGLSAIVVLGGTTLLLMNSQFLFGTVQRIQTDSEMLRIEHELRRVVRQALFVRLTGAAGEGWISTYDSRPTTALATVGVFDREDARKRNAGVDSIIRATGLFFKPPSVATDGTEYEGVFFIDHDNDGDGQLSPDYGRFHGAGLVALRILNPIELPVLGSAFQRLRSIDFEFTTRTFMPQTDSRERCFRVTGCSAEALALSKDTIRIFTLRLTNNSFGADVFSPLSLSQADPVYFFREY